MSDYRVRMANMSDVAALANICVECFPNDYLASSENAQATSIAANWVEKRMSIAPYAVYVVAESNKTAKVVGYNVWLLGACASGTVHSDQIGVTFLHRGKGLGTLLKLESETMLRDILDSTFGRPLEQLTGTTSIHNIAMQRVYEKCGYGRRAELGAMYFGEPEVLFCKRFGF